MKLYHEKWAVQMGDSPPPHPRSVLFNACLSLELPSTERVIPASKQSGGYKHEVFLFVPV